MKYDLKEYINAANGIFTTQEASYTVQSGNDPLKVFNHLCCPLQLIRIDDHGHPVLVGPDSKRIPLPPNMETNIRQYADIPDGARFSISIAPTGAYVGMIKIIDGKEIHIFISDLMEPNFIGNPPVPMKGKIIPTDSTRICVGMGLLNTDGRKFLLREQYWKLSPDSYILDAGEERTITFRTQQGMQDTSSSQETITKSFNSSVSVGWGPIQASISASLSMSSTVSHSLTLSTNTEKFESYTKKNESAGIRLYLLWQLIDIVSVYTTAAVPTCEAAIVMAQQPCILQSFDMGDLLMS